MKHKINSVLVLIMIIASMTAVFANETEITDIQGHWGQSNIEYLVNKGAISGYPDGTFQPNKTISRAEFVAIAVRAGQGGTTSASPQGAHWATGVFQDAYKNDVLKQTEMPQNKWNEPISRYEMTMVMVRITENILKESKTSTTGVAKIMADYQTVSKKPQYKYYVEQAFMKGLISGMDEQGTFAGDRSATRAEAATVVMRILDKSSRKEVDTNKVVEVPQGSGTTIVWNSPDKPLVPKAGDVFVKEDGTKVVLKAHPESGVLGHGQGVDLYSGIKFDNGKVFKEGSLGVPEMGYPSQPYLLDKNGEGHFAEQWDAIANYELAEARKIQNPTHGQTYGEWCYYHGSVGWTWTGPRN